MIAVKSRDKVELLSPLLFFSLFFSFPSLPLSFLSTGFAPTCSSGMSPPCHLSPLHWLSWISPYPLIQFFGLPSSQVVTHVPHRPHLDFCLTCSPFDTWLHISHPTSAKCHSLLSVPQKNVKFRLPQNSTKFDRVTRFHEMIPTMKSISSSKI